MLKSYLSYVFVDETIMRILAIGINC